MDELKKKIIKKIENLEDEGVLRVIDRMLSQKKEIKELEEFVVESRIEEIEDDEFIDHDEAVKQAASSLKTKKGPEL